MASAWVEYKTAIPFRHGRQGGVQVSMEAFREGLRDGGNTVLVELG